MDDPTALLTSFDDGVDEKTARSVPSRSKTVAVIECSPQLGLVEMARRTYNVLITQHRAACGEEDCPHSWVDTEVVARKSVGEACQTYDFVAGPGYMRGTLLATYSMKKPCSSCGVNLIFKLSGGSEVVEVDGKKEFRIDNGCTGRPFVVVCSSQPKAFHVSEPELQKAVLSPPTFFQLMAEGVPLPNESFNEESGCFTVRVSESQLAQFLEHFKSVAREEVDWQSLLPYADRFSEIYPPTVAFPNGDPSLAAMQFGIVTAKQAVQLVLLAVEQTLNVSLAVVKKYMYRGVRVLLVYYMQCDFKKRVLGDGVAGVLDVDPVDGSALDVSAVTTPKPAAKKGRKRIKEDDDEDMPVVPLLSVASAAGAGEEVPPPADFASPDAMGSVEEGKSAKARRSRARASEGRCPAKFTVKIVQGGVSGSELSIEVTIPSLGAHVGHDPSTGHCEVTPIAEHIFVRLLGEGVKPKIARVQAEADVRNLRKSMHIEMLKQQEAQYGASLAEAAEQGNGERVAALELELAALAQKRQEQEDAVVEAPGTVDSGGEILSRARADNLARTWNIARKKKEAAPVEYAEADDAAPASVVLV